MVAAEAQAQGVPVSLALAIAQRESGFSQAARGAAGEIGVMQLMPATAAQLGVDPYDLAQNIHGGILFLADLYRQFGDWTLTAEAYNWGPNKLARALAAKRQAPASVQQYARAVTSGAPISTPAGGIQVAGYQVVQPDAGAPMPGNTSPAIMGGLLALGIVAAVWAVT